MNNQIIQGDALTKLKELESKSINMCMTSPPYWALRDYGVKGQLGLEPTFDLYIKHLCDIFDEVKRVLRDDGTCWINLGDTYYGSSSYSDSGRAGFSGKDDDMWKRQFGDGKCLTCGKTCETQFCNRTCLNKHGNKFRSQNRLPPDKSLVMIPFRFAIEMVNRGWILRNTIIWHKPNAMPSSVKDRFTVDFEYLFFFSKKKKYYFETQYKPLRTSSIERLNQNIENQKGSQRGIGGLSGKRNIKAVATKISPNTSRPNSPHYRKDYSHDYQTLGKNERTVWSISSKPFSEAHFAVYPEELCETPIKAGCPEGGIVLDHFFGSGTTGLVALKQNKKFIGIELNEEYIEIAKKRLKPFLEQERLK